jgi:hypothetical protein
MTGALTIETITLTFDMVLNPKEAREVAIDVVSSLRRSGFQLTVRARPQRSGRPLAAGIVLVFALLAVLSVRGLLFWAQPMTALASANHLTAP